MSECVYNVADGLRQLRRAGRITEEQYHAGLERAKTMPVVTEPVPEFDPEFQRVLDMVRHPAERDLQCEIDLTTAIYLGSGCGVCGRSQAGCVMVPLESVPAPR
jgi:hypothetical protein